MILKKEFNILKKPYLAPRIEFEEIEADEREMLMTSNNGTGAPGTSGGDTGGNEMSSLNVMFEDNSSEQISEPFSDFIMNDGL